MITPIPDLLDPTPIDTPEMDVRPRRGLTWKGKHISSSPTVERTQGEGVDIMAETEDELKAQSLGLKDLVDYQDGSVVSRTLIDKPTGTVTLFSFDTGQGLSEHTAPFDAMVNVVDGEAEVMISGEPHTVNEGEMIIMPANKPHALRANKPFKMLLVLVRD